MKSVREESLQSLIEKMRCIMKTMHMGHPFGGITLGRPQVVILFFIARNKGASVKELAEMLRVTPGAISQFTDDLVEKNLVKREEDKKDRRIIKISLTKKAEDKFKEFKKNYFHSVSPLFDNLDDQDLKTLIVLLEKVRVSEKEKSCKI